MTDPKRSPDDLACFDARKVVKAGLGDDYDRLVEPARHALQAAMWDHRVSASAAAGAAATHAMATGEAPEVASIFLAAAADILENAN